MLGLTVALVVILVVAVVFLAALTLDKGVEKYESRK